MDPSKITTKNYPVFNSYQRWFKYQVDSKCSINMKYRFLTVH